jgi:hypothetical protein
MKLFLEIFWPELRYVRVWYSIAYVTVIFILMNAVNQTQISKQHEKEKEICFNTNRQAHDFVRKCAINDGVWVCKHRAYELFCS